jgi:hypothetical protein
VIHATSVDAVHAQSLLVVTATEPLPAAAFTLWLEGETSYRHGARCDTLTRVSLTTISPLRAAEPSFAATRYARSPPPWPETGEMLEIQFTVLEAFHAHSGCAVTLTEPDPPPASIIGGVVAVSSHFADVGLTATVSVVDEV